MQFLGALRHGKPPAIGPRVLVVGGGNAAIDAARSARRLVGARGLVRIVYRRTRAEMPAEAGEIEAALAEGIELIELAVPTRLLKENGRLKTASCLRMKLGPPDHSGRRRPLVIEGSQFDIRTDTMIAAIGQQAVLDFLQGANVVTVPNLVESGQGADKDPGPDRILAGGDACRGPATLVKAIADGNYDTPERLDAAIDAMLREVLEDESGPSTK